MSGAIPHQIYATPEEMTSPGFFERRLGRPVVHVRTQPLTAGFAHSGSELHRVTVRLAGDPAAAPEECFILKRLNPSWDWLMQITDDRACRSVTLWERGVFDLLPAGVDTTTVACAHDGEGFAILMRDAGASLVTNQRFTREQNNSFVDTLAAIHARFLHPAEDPDPTLTDPSLGLCSAVDVFRMFSPATAAQFASLDRDIHRRIQQGWEAAADIMPVDVVDIVRPLVADPGPLVHALGRYPHTLVHGDFRHSNLGWQYGTTILLDWQLATYAPPAVDLGRYIGANSPFLPEEKDSLLERYRNRLEHHLTRSTPVTETPPLDRWWEPQLYLGLLGGFIQDGWAIALKATTWDIAEDTREQWKADLPWWSEVVRRGGRVLLL